MENNVLDRRAFFEAEAWLDSKLLALGIMPNLLGYDQLKEAVLLKLKSYSHKVTGDIYAYVAAKFNTATTNVERNIRSALQQSYKSGALLRLNSMFGVTIMNENYCLTNNQFISLMAHFAYRTVAPSPFKFEENRI